MLTTAILDSIFNPFYLIGACLFILIIAVLSKIITERFIIPEKLNNYYRNSFISYLISLVLTAIIAVTVYPFYGEGLLDNTYLTSFIDNIYLYMLSYSIPFVLILFLSEYVLKHLMNNISIRYVITEIIIIISLMALFFSFLLLG